MIKTILAGDLSLASPGFSVLEFDLDKRTAKVLHVSHIKTNSKKSTGYRLWQIANHLEVFILDQYDIDHVVIEKGFSRFPTATQQIQRTVGVFFYCMHMKYGLDADEIAVTTVKKAITGNGKSDKKEVAEALPSFVGDINYKNDDESDSVAVGIAYAKSKKWV